MKNRVGFGFIDSGSGCPNFRGNAGPDKFGHSDKCPDPIFLAYKIWAANEFGHSDIRSFGYSVTKIDKTTEKNSMKNGTNSVIRTFGRTFGSGFGHDCLSELQFGLGFG